MVSQVIENNHIEVVRTVMYSNKNIGGVLNNKAPEVSRDICMKFDRVNDMLTNLCCDVYPYRKEDKAVAEFLTALADIKYCFYNLNLAIQRPNSVFRK